MRYLVLMDHRGMLYYELRLGEDAVRVVASARRLGYNAIKAEKA